MCICISRCCDEVFGSILFSDMYAKTHRVYFDNQGVPFIILAQKNMDCHHGVDRQLVAKEKRKKYKSNQKVLKLLKFN